MRRERCDEAAIRTIYISTIGINVSQKAQAEVQRGGGNVVTGNMERVIPGERAAH